MTALLNAARAGEEDAKDRLVRAAYGELRRMAAGFMRRERTDHTLQPSALVNEAVIRLLDGGEFRCPAAHNAVGLAGESPAVGIDCLST